jgi:hypothetical protein
MHHDRNHPRSNHREPFTVGGYDPTGAFLLLRIAGAQARLDHTRSALARDSRLVALTRALLLQKLRPSFEKRDRLMVIRNGTQELLQAMINSDGPGAQKAEDQLAKLRFYLADQYEYAHTEARRQLEDLESERLCSKAQPACGFRKARSSRGQFMAPDNGTPQDPLLQCLRNLEEETLQVEQEHDALRDSPDYQFAKEAERDSQCMDTLVEEQAQLAESASARLIREIEELESKVRSLGTKAVSPAG